MSSSIHILFITSSVVPCRQGLSIGRDGTIFETTGLNGQSKVRRINPDTFEVELSKDVDGKYFGEGSTTYTDAVGNERLIEITWKKQTGFTYNAKTLEQLTEFKYTTSSGNQGWGITYDESNQEFIVSDGSQYLFFWDRDTLKEKRRVAVTRFNGSEQRQLNELEYIDGLVCANIWYQDASKFAFMIIFVVLFMQFAHPLCLFCSNMR